VQKYQTKKLEETVPFLPLRRKSCKVYKWQVVLAKVSCVAHRFSEVATKPRNGRFCFSGVRVRGSGPPSVFKPDTADANVGSRTRASRAMTRSSSTPLPSRDDATIATRYTADAQAETVSGFPVAGARVPAVGGVAKSRSTGNADFPVNHLLASAGSAETVGVEPHDADDAHACTSIDTDEGVVLQAFAPLDTHRGPRPEHATSPKKTVASSGVPFVAPFEDHFGTDGTGTISPGPPISSMSPPETSSVIRLIEITDRDALELKSVFGGNRHHASSPDSVLSSSHHSGRASFFDSDSELDEAEAETEAGRRTSTSVGPPDDSSHLETERTGGSRKSDITALLPEASSPSKKMVSFAEYSEWSVHDIGSCWDLAREKTGHASSLNASQVVGWLAERHVLGWFSKVFFKGDGAPAASARLLEQTIRRALRESRRNMHANVEYNVAFSEAADAGGEGREFASLRTKRRDRRKTRDASRSKPRW